MSSVNEFRNLIAGLSDGVLSETELSRLGELLKADPIAQEEYLDHMLMDGLLELEFHGDPTSRGDGGFPVGGSFPGDGGPILFENVPSTLPNVERRSSASLSRWPGFVTAALALVIAVGWLAWGDRSGNFDSQALALADSGFESGMANQVGGSWYGDSVDVVERFSDVTPHEGSRMLRFVKSRIEPEDACELYQIVDFTSLSDTLTRHPMSVEASAFFNAISEELLDDNFSFGITVFAFSEKPSEWPPTWPLRWEHALTYSGSHEVADDDSRSWQQVKTRLPLPADTKYLLVQLTVIRTDVDADEEESEFPGQFADNVRLKLVCLE